MKLFLQVFIILIVFLKTGNLLSENKLFSVNNITLEKDDITSNEKLANEAIIKGFNQLIDRILLEEDLIKISNLQPKIIKELVSYYNILKPSKEENNKIINFNVTFDKDKIHDLFYKRQISYSDISDKEFYILPILLRNNDLFVFSNNFFYRDWNEIDEESLIDFILPLENIEIIQSVNKSRQNLNEIELSSIFKEYSNKNVGLVIIEEKENNIEKAYLKLLIENKLISKNLFFKKETNNLTKKKTIEIKKEIINLIKSQNLIDVSAPSFINVKLKLDDKNNLFLLNKKIKKIDLIENIFVQELNKDHVNLKIKYLGKLEKIIYQFKDLDISLKLINDEWLIKIL